MLPDIAAQRISTIPRGRRGRQFLIDLFPHLQANRAGVREIGIVTANVEGDRKIEQWLVSLQGDCRTASLRLGDSRRRWRRCSRVLRDRRSRSAAARRIRLSYSGTGKSSQENGCGKAERTKCG